MAYAAWTLIIGIPIVGAIFYLDHKGWPPAK